MSVKRFLGVILVLVGIVALIQYKFGDKSASLDYDRTWTFDNTELKELTIVSDSMGLDVKFVKSTDGSNSVRITGRAKEDVVDEVKSTDLEDGQLKIDLKGKWRFNLFDFSAFRSNNQSVTVTLTDEARKSLETLNISADSGSLNAAGAAARNGTFKSDSGSIRLEGFEGDTLSLKSDSGSIKLSDYQGTELSIKSDSGSIHGENIRAEVKASSDSGSITFDRLSGTAQVSSDSGRIELTKEDSTGANVKSDSGSVRIEVPASYSGTYDLKSDSGSVREPDQHGTSGEVIKVRTDSGSIRVEQNQ
ncbi:putative adhesin [Paenibacillus cellulosilyticus]|uniref:Putative adhesin n=1 Tax=Paenibacillus cellulosilyticus TaxID=375489 RepID=A0A2V2Z375_9BACL|nr:DUF4097 family beta strand repeat-containing protein [Paenibacillus cellulosilyticus]PWW08716.1 putative adhesin [Paenibacillus cellulosilyticus]QKS48280.1 DUF4097 family beta strand repeat protein [Paenibacillus cellulosilyticus]